MTRDEFINIGSLLSKISKWPRWPYWFYWFIEFESALTKSRFTAETQRTLREFSYDPIGRRRSDHKLSPFEDGSKVASHHTVAAKNGFFDVKEGFLFGGLSPPNKKIIPLRPRRLYGEISILDESDFG